MKQITILLSPDHEEGLYIYAISLGNRSDLLANAHHNIGVVLSWLYGYSQKLNVSMDVFYDNGRIEHFATINPVDTWKSNYSPHVDPPIPFDHKITNIIKLADELSERMVVI